MTLAEQLYKRWTQMVSYQSLARTLWQDLGEFINIKRSFVITKRKEGTSQTQHLFDSTAPKANDDLAAFISGTLTNMAMLWFGIRADDERWNNDTDVRVWLDACAEVIYKYLRRSNFNTEIQETYKDLGAFGTACLLLEEMIEDGRFTGFLFRAEAIGSYTISEDADGSVNTVFRRLVLPGEAAFAKWGKNLSEKTRDKIEKNPDEKVNIIHAVFPWKSMAGLKNLDKPIASVYFEEEEKRKLEVNGYYELPFFVPRWSKTSGEMYGRGPGHTALPDILSLNKAIELTLMAWAKAANPPLLAVDDAVLGDVRSIPDGITWVRNPDALRYLESRGRFDVNQQLVADVRASIKDIFFSNQFTLPDKSIITATEVERRLELMQQVLGPVVGRLEYELLSPLINRAFQILLRNGLLPSPPKQFARAAMTAGGIGLSVSYEGPLARSQRNADIKATNDAVTFVAALGEIYPEGKDNVDWDTMIQDRLLKSGIPSKYIRGTVAREQLRAQRNEAIQQQAQLEQQELQGKAMQSSAQGIKSMSEANVPQLQQMAEAMNGASDEGGDSEEL